MFYKRWYFWLIIVILFVGTLLPLVLIFATSPYENTQSFILFWIVIGATLFLTIAVFRLDNTQRVINDRKDELMQKLLVTPEVLFMDIGREFDPIQQNMLHVDNIIYCLDAKAKSNFYNYKIQVIPLSDIVIDNNEIGNYECGINTEETNYDYFSSAGRSISQLLLKRANEYYCYFQIPKDANEFDIKLNFTYKNIYGMKYSKSAVYKYTPGRKGTGNQTIGRYLSLQSKSNAINID